MALLVLALLYVGARRLEHLRYVAGDPLIARFCGLARIPTARTVGNWLRQFTQATLAPLVQLNHDLVIDAIKRLALPRLTIDVDGTVVRTGATVGWAFRGFNPASPEGSQLLPAAGPRRPDGPHPAGEESARQRARFQAGRRRSCAR